MEEDKSKGRPGEPGRDATGIQGGTGGAGGTGGEGQTTGGAGGYRRIGWSIKCPRGRGRSCRDRYFQSKRVALDCDRVHDLGGRSRVGTLLWPESAEICSVRQVN
jgi:hypothetical protein